jgi:hypothetical protein
MSLVKMLMMKVDFEMYKSDKVPEVESSENTEEVEVEAFAVPPHCVPIRKDVRFVDWTVRNSYGYR